MKLKEIYYDPKHPAGFSSIQKLSEASGLSTKRVKEWLKAQPTYTLHKSARKKYRTRAYVVHRKDEQWQSDICEMQLISKDNDAYRYILTVIDLYSRYAWARPLKTKTGKDTADAFRDIFEEGRIPQRIQTDQGKEFENHHVRGLCQEHNIELFSIKSAYKAAVVERFNRTLKGKLYKYFTSNMTNRWIDVLQDVVYSYNHSKHRSIKRTPASVTDVSDIQRPKRATSRTDIKVGDKVRISKVKSVFAKGYLANWTEEVFTVESINRKFTPISYKLKDYNNEVIEGSFYRHEIQPITQTDDVFLVEKIIRKEKRGRETWCLVKWEGYPTSMNSWVREKDVTHVTNRK